MIINVYELNMLYKEVLKSTNGDSAAAIELINNAGNECCGSLFKANGSRKILKIKCENGKLYQYFTGDYKAVILNNKTLGKYNISYEALLFFRKYLGEDFRPTYLNVNDLYKIANNIYESNKKLFPRSGQIENMRRTINMISTCDYSDEIIFKVMDGTKLVIGVGEDDGRLYQTLYKYDNEFFVEVKVSDTVFISNSTLKKFPLTQSGEEFVNIWLKNTI